MHEEWFAAAHIRPYVLLDENELVVMPTMSWDYLNCGYRRGAPTTTNRPAGPARGSIGAIIGQFKSVTTKRTNETRGTPGSPVWQRNYYEHIILR